MKYVLLTGGAGFIGANFVNSISQNRDYRLIVLDALTYAGHFPNLAPAIANGAEFIHGDICDTNLLQELFNRFSFHGVINFAAESHVDRSIEGPDIFYQTNVGGTLNLLKHSLETWKKEKDFRFLQVSTDEVYGSLNVGDAPFSETTPLAPSSPYSASKAAADLFVQAFHTTYGLPVVITRCSNNYGPLQFREKLIPLMITRAATGMRLPVYGTGRNIRDWIHVDDHVRGIWLAFTKGRNGEVYNFGGNAEKDNLSIVKLILDKLGYTHDLIEFVPDRPGHDFRYAIDFHKSTRELGWQPAVDFHHGLEQTIEWYLSHPKWRLEDCQ